MAQVFAVKFSGASCLHDRVSRESASRCLRPLLRSTAPRRQIMSSAASARSDATSDGLMEPCVSWRELTVAVRADATQKVQGPRGVFFRPSLRCSYLPARTPRVVVGASVRSVAYTPLSWDLNGVLSDRGTMSKADEYQARHELTALEAIFFGSTVKHH
jgi:hypothetical protein